MTRNLEAARAAWKHRGLERPAFAIEPKPGQESVWDYPRPPRLEHDNRPVQVRYGGKVIAQTNRAYRVLETASPPTFYVPPEDVDLALLVPSHGSSACEWKGNARYWSLDIGQAHIDRAAWSYPDPYPSFEAIRGYFSFYPALVECYVDGHRVAPQPGGFYGGWITPEIVGPFKGEAGTAGW